MITCVLGPTGSGKSYVVDHCFGSALFVKGRPGRVIRESIGMAPAQKEQNPNRWDLTEQLVRNYVAGLIQVASDLNRPLVLDGFPRDGPQASWFVEHLMMRGVKSVGVMIVHSKRPESSFVDTEEADPVEAERHRRSIEDYRESARVVAKYFGDSAIDVVEVPWNGF
jgi:adenylate kinase family enzyme